MKDFLNSPCNGSMKRPILILIVVVVAAVGLIVSYHTTDRFMNLEKAKNSFGYGPQASNTTLGEWRIAALDGDPRAQVQLGSLYEAGNQVPQSYSLAMRWYRKAEQQGFPPAKLRMGNLHFKGLGVPQDFGTAANWFHKASRLGNLIGTFNIGFLFHQGHIIKSGMGGFKTNATPKPDFKKAMEWYTKASDEGYGHAAFAIALMYEKGEGMEANPEEVTKWLKKASTDGDYDLKYRVANTFRQGLGVEKDPAAALEIYSQGMFVNNRQVKQVAIAGIRTIYAEGYQGTKLADLEWKFQNLGSKWEDAKNNCAKDESGYRLSTFHETIAAMQTVWPKEFSETISKTGAVGIWTLNSDPKGDKAITLGIGITEDKKGIDFTATNVVLLPKTSPLINNKFPVLAMCVKPKEKG